MDDFWHLALILIMIYYRRRWGVLLLIITVFWGWNPGLMAFISIMGLILGEDSSAPKRIKHRTITTYNNKYDIVEDERED